MGWALIGIAAACLGLAILINQAWPILFLAGVLILLLVIAIRREERHLHSSFPDEYREYCRRVGRWVQAMPNGAAATATPGRKEK